ncbi:MAG: peptidoglycan DD-metalloendopeptidase family protein [Saprospiraceae bacterium]
MKKISSLLLLCSFPISSYTQNWQASALENAAGFPIEKKVADHPCITAETYALVEQRCAENLAVLGLSATEQKSDLITALNWPLRAANGLMDCSYYAIGAYVDHNTATGLISDYNCGTKTYDGHRGTDIGMPPFAFYKMDNNHVEVIAAAAGILLDKADGNFDRNCGANNIPANYVIIQHSDGSRALYWHLKKNSVTTKNIGQAVAAGEYLAVVGSSGSSSGPHLHFEVWNGSTSSTRVDPYSGSCNALNATSWWAAQKPYTEPAIVKASVHTTDIVLPGCPNTETLNESKSFSLPFQGPGLPAGSAKFYIFMRNETMGMTASISILNPDGSTLNSWTHSSTSSYGTSWRAWTKPLPTKAGTYILKATYNGTSCSSAFEIINPINTGTEELSEHNTVVIVPNPNNGTFTIEMKNGDTQATGRWIEIYNLLGDKILVSEGQGTTVAIDISNQPNGIYFARIHTTKGEQVLRFLKM